MKPKQPKIPKGWRKLRVGNKRRDGDLFHFDSTFIKTLRYGDVITAHDMRASGPFIRRIAKGKAKR